MIRVGVAGWDYADWAGIVYPSPRPRAFDRLRFIADLFDTIEINVSFYRPIAAPGARAWAARLAPDRAFLFTAKLHRGLTHAEAPAASELRERARAFLAGIGPLRAAGRLGAVLMQFPQSFHNDRAGRARIAALREHLEDLPLVAEFRHRGWDETGALESLRAAGIGFCNIDQPDLAATLRPTEHVTSPIAYVRFHGRNARAWFAPRGTEETPRGGGAARYDYLYSMEEMAPWVARVRRMADRAEEVFVIANNHYRGKGPANALMVKSALAGRRVPGPASLVAVYPDLKESVDPVAPRRGKSPRQGRLF